MLSLEGSPKDPKVNTLSFGGYLASACGRFTFHVHLQHDLHSQFWLFHSLKMTKTGEKHLKSYDCLDYSLSSSGLGNFIHDVSIEKQETKIFHKKSKVISVT